MYCFVITCQTKLWHKWISILREEIVHDMIHIHQNCNCQALYGVSNSKGKTGERRNESLSLSQLHRILNWCEPIEILQSNFDLPAFVSSVCFVRWDVMDWRGVPGYDQDLQLTKTFMLRWSQRLMTIEKTNDRQEFVHLSSWIYSSTTFDIFCHPPRFPNAMDEISREDLSAQTDRDSWQTLLLWTYSY